MGKLDKVITALEQCHRDVKYRDCDRCGYAEAGCECERCLMEDALELLKSREDVHPDWYERLEKLDYDYNPVKDGTPWYKADAVWACIEDIPDGHREFGAHMDEGLELRTCYCPICDKHFEVRSNDSMGHCPDCGHHVVLHIEGETDG